MLKYYPLVDTNADGTDKVAMFCVENPFDAFHSNHFALETSFPKYYRLVTTEATHVQDYPSYTIHCPKCGAAMKLSNPHKDIHTLGEYTCVNC